MTAFPDPEIDKVDSPHRCSSCGWVGFGEHTCAPFGESYKSIAQRQMVDGRLEALFAKRKDDPEIAELFAHIKFLDQMATSAWTTLKYRSDEIKGLREKLAKLETHS